MKKKVLKYLKLVSHLVETFYQHLMEKLQKNSMSHFRKFVLFFQKPKIRNYIFITIIFDLYKNYESKKLVRNLGLLGKNQIKKKKRFYGSYRL